MFVVRMQRIDDVRKVVVKLSASVDSTQRLLQITAYLKFLKNNNYNNTVVVFVLHIDSTLNIAPLPNGNASTRKNGVNSVRQVAALRRMWHVSSWQLMGGEQEHASKGHTIALTERA